VAELEKMLTMPVFLSESVCSAEGGSGDYKDSGMI